MSRTSSQSLSGTHLWRLSCLCITSVDTRKQTVLQFDKMESSVSLSCCCSHWSFCLLLGQESFLSFHPEDKDHHAAESSALGLLHWSPPLKELPEELPEPLLPALCHQSESLLALSSVDLDQEVRTPSWKSIWAQCCSEVLHCLLQKAACFSQKIKPVRDVKGRSTDLTVCGTASVDNLWLASRPVAFSV